MTGLQTIILNNSFYNGLRVRLSCNGHTNLQGTNGAGKTSMLRLIPIFYGYEPNRLVDKFAGKSSFVDYYLPNHQSMIVFEYTRATGETCCAVLFRRGADTGFAYRLIKGAANDTIFHPELEPFYKEGLDANTIMLDHMPKYGVTASSMINRIIDYRSIIQNDPSGGGKRSAVSRAGVDVRGLSGQFSLVDVKSKMLHIDSLTTVSLRKDQMISRLKEMIVDSMLNHAAFVGDPPTHDKNIDLWSDLKSLSAFLNNQGLIESALSSFSRAQSNRADLIHARRRVLELKNLGEQKVCDLQKGIEKLKAQMNEHTAVFEDNSFELSKKSAGHKGAADQFEREITALHQSQARYKDEKNMHYWVGEYERSPQIKVALEAAQTRLDFCRSGSDDILKKADELKAKVGEDRDRQIADVDAQKDKVARQIDSLQESFRGDLRELQVVIRKETDDKTAFNAELAKSLEAAIEQLREEADIAAEFTESEKARRDRAKQARELNRRDLANARALERELLKNSELARKESNAAESAHSQANDKCSLIIDNRQSLLDLLYPDDGSLLSFLRESGIAWEQSLGKTINPELLGRKDLRPRVLDSAAMSANFFGVELALEELALPALAENEAVLKERLQRVEMDLKAANDDLEVLAKKWKDAQDAEKLNNTAHQKKKNEVFKLSDLVEQAERELEAVTVAVGLEVSARDQTFRERIKQAVTSKKNKLNKAAVELVQLNQLHDDQQKELSEELDRACQLLSEQLSKLNAKVDDINGWLKDEHCRIDEARNKGLSEKGFDVESISEAEAEVRSLKLQLTEIESRHQDIQSYLHWLEANWSQLPELKKRLAIEHKSIRAVQQRLDEEKTEYERKKEAIKKQIDKFNTEVEKLIDRVTEWGGAESIAQEVIACIPVATQADDKNRPEQSVSLDLAEMIVQNLGQLTTTTERLVEEVVDALVKSSNAINQNPESHIYQKWQYLRNARLQTSTHSEGTKAYRMESMLDLRRIMEHDVPEIRKALIENVKSAGGQMARYYDELCDINKRVKHVSQILENKLNTEHDFDAISSIQVRLVSKVENFDYWSHLKSFASEWHDWNLTRNHDLPPESLQKSLQLLDSMFKRAKMSNNDIGSLVDLVINITENGRLVPVLSDSDLRNVSSTGLSSIVVMVIFAALTRYLCPDEKVSIIWPIDELGELHPTNVDKLFKMMDKKNIVMFCAQPAASHEFLKRYKYCYHLSQNYGVRDFVSVQRASEKNPLRKLLEQRDTDLTQEGAGQ